MILTAAFGKDRKKRDHWTPMKGLEADYRQEPDGVVSCSNSAKLVSAETSEIK